MKDEVAEVDQDPAAGRRSFHEQRLQAFVLAHSVNDAVLISSTDIRYRVRAGQPIDAFVDPQVSRYIHHYGLYK